MANVYQTGLFVGSSLPPSISKAKLAAPDYLVVGTIIVTNVLVYSQLATWET